MAAPPATLQLPAESWKAACGAGRPRAAEAWQGRTGQAPGKGRPCRAAALWARQVCVAALQLCVSELAQAPGSTSACRRQSMSPSQQQHVQERTHPQARPAGLRAACIASPGAKWPLSRRSSSAAARTPSSARRCRSCSAQALRTPSLRSLSARARCAPPKAAPAAPDQILGDGCALHALPSCSTARAGRCTAVQLALARMLQQTCAGPVRELGSVRPGQRRARQRGLPGPAEGRQEARRPRQGGLALTAAVGPWQGARCCAKGGGLSRLCSPGTSWQTPLRTGCRVQVLRHRKASSTAAAVAALGSRADRHCLSSPPVQGEARSCGCSYLHPDDPGRTERFQALPSPSADARVPAAHPTLSNCAQAAARKSRSSEDARGVHRRPF